MRPRDPNDKGWIPTFSGRRFWPLDPDPDDLNIRDIAHALSNCCRFAGHCKTFYSVADHSVMVSEIVSPGMALIGLLHDATEAYLGDMVRPVKRSLGDYQQAEDKLWQCVAEHYCLPQVLPHEVKVADNVALATERRDLVVKPYDHEWSLLPNNLQPLPGRIEAAQPWESERDFLNRYRRLVSCARLAVSETALLAEMAGEIARAQSLSTEAERLRRLLDEANDGEPR